MSEPTAPAVVVTDGGEASLSPATLAGLLRAVLEKGRPFRFEVKGGSMSPFVRSGDVVTVSPPAPRGPRTGAVVAFIYPGTDKVAVHRVVGTRGGRFVLRGDNVEAADGEVPRDRILGVVTEVRRGGRSLRGITGASAAAIAWLSRTGRLFRVLARARRIAGKREPGR